MKQYVDYLFTFSVGTYLIIATNKGIAIPSVLEWLFVILILFAAISAIVTFGGFGVFFAILPRNLDYFGRDGKQNKHAQVAFMSAAHSVEPFSTPAGFNLSLIGSMILMAGIQMQGWYVTLCFEILGSAIGYGFIRYFKNNAKAISELIFVTEETA